MALKDGRVAVLFSGGIDSMLLAERAHKEKRLGALVFIDYGQPASSYEMKTVNAWASERGYEVDSIEVRIEGVDECMDIGAEAEGLRILPGRNMIMCAHAANIAASKDCTVVWYGANADDKDYPDCSRNFVCAMNDILGASSVDVLIEAPLIGMTKKQIIEECQKIGMDLDYAWSCYQPVYGCPCGKCHSCQERIKAMA